MKLPISSFADELKKTIRDHAVTIVVGETGCGKTTQVPQMVLDDMILRGKGAGCDIVCTQPRRVAACGVAERVAAERCERAGEPGVLLRRLQDDPDLIGISHVVVDEAHERDILCDFLLILLREP
ncbi:P-loop containing nucleoside triphosphate hydrolase protein [Baffinella frigidus]|nr:P-loop containing nucleoside triphosphate hydrolase protein [Cryptophyta sp. CCMP2293]